MNVEIDGKLIAVPMAVEAEGPEAIDAYVRAEAEKLGLVYSPVPAPVPAPSSPPQE